LKEEFLEFGPFVSDGMERSVDGVDDQNDFGRRIGWGTGRAIYGVKRENVLRPFVVQKRKVLFLEPANGGTGFVRDLHFECDLPVSTGCRSR
jgi:hypothetical protein